MSVGAEDARDMTWWEYSARLTVWQERNATDDDPVEAPDVDRVRRNMERLNGISPSEMAMN